LYDKGTFIFLPALTDSTSKCSPHNC